MPRPSDTAVGPAPSSTDGLLPPAPSLPPPGRRALLIGAVVMFVLWVAALAWLTVTTANPPQINLAQLARARHIVQVEVEDVAAGRCRVVKAWTPGNLSETITVSNLSETAAQPNGEYVLPLAGDPGDPQAYRIVDDPAREMPPYIYPAVPEIFRQLDAR